MLNDSVKNAYFIVTASNKVYDESGNILSKYVDRVRFHKTGFTSYVAPNCIKINSEKIRKAIFYIFDPNFLIGYSAELTGLPTNKIGIPTENIIGSSLSKDSFPTNVTRPDTNKAKDYIKQINDLPNGDNEKNTLIYYQNNYMYYTLPFNSNPNFNNIRNKYESLIDSAFKSIGLKGFKFEILPSNNYYNTLYSRLYQNDQTINNPNSLKEFTRIGWSADYDNAITVIPELLSYFGAYNFTNNYEDSYINEFESKITEAKNLTDRNKQAEAWKELDKFAMDRMWLIPIYEIYDTSGSGSLVRNLIPSFIGGDMSWGFGYVTK